MAGKNWRSVYGWYGHPQAHPPICGFIDAFLSRKTKEGEEEERKEGGFWGYTRLVPLLLCFLLLVLIIDESLRFDLLKRWIDTDWTCERLRNVAVIR